MVSIATDKNGHRRILFVAPNGRRKTIRMGAVPLRAVEAVKFRLEEILAAQVSGYAVDKDTAQ